MTVAPGTNSCVIIGAGISGLLVAQELQNAGWRVTVLDKSRGVGGRMATRRLGDGNFDHGAQFFTVRGDRFGKLVDEWMEAGAVEEWSRGFPDGISEKAPDGHPRYRGAEGMTSIPKHLAQDVDVRSAEKAVEIHQQGDGWNVVCESGLEVSGGSLLITAPAPQAMELAESGNYRIPDDPRQGLSEITYDPCVALMALLENPPTGVPEPGGIQIKSEPLDWIGDNQQKGISRSPGLTIHGGPKWSQEHYEASEDELTEELLSIAGDYLDSNITPRVVETSLARWRYSWVTNAHPDPYLVASEEPSLIFAGDGFGQPKVEGAALSGLSAADYLLGS